MKWINGSEDAMRVHIFRRADAKRIGSPRPRPALSYSPQRGCGMKRSHGGAPAMDVCVLPREDEKPRRGIMRGIGFCDC